MVKQDEVKRLLTLFVCRCGCDYFQKKAVNCLSAFFYLGLGGMV